MAFAEYQISLGHKWAENYALKGNSVYVIFSKIVISIISVIRCYKLLCLGVCVLGLFFDSEVGAIYSSET
jgi:hypothetical protein